MSTSNNSTVNPDYPRYLGDGVYASFDGYQVWLGLEHHTSKIIALDDRTAKALVKYLKDLEEVKGVPK